MRAALIGSGGPVLGREYALDAPVVTIGRRDENNVVIKDPTVSRKHAMIRREGDDFILVDNNSTSGVTVNGQPITGEYRLHDGDRVGIGGSALFTVQLAPEESKTVTFSREQLDQAAGDHTVSFSRDDFPRYQPPAASETPAAQRAAQSYQAAGDTSFVGPIGEVHQTRDEESPPPMSSTAPPAGRFTPPPANTAGPPAGSSYAPPPASTPPPQLPPLPGTFQGAGAAPQGKGGPQLPPLTPPGSSQQAPPPAYSGAPNLPSIAPPGNAPQFNAPPSFAPPPGPAASGPPQANFAPPPGPAAMSAPTPMPAPGAAQPMLAPPPAPAKKGAPTGLIIGLVVLILLIIVALAVVAFLLLKK
ncbi:MAG TPA: FHA domain-containing protein [Thermomicrobiales bacterium]|nr:FHA domain-containing protein [Thermomicrobiales bacterium]